MVMETEDEHKMKVIRNLSNKSVLAARLDLSKSNLDGSSGEAWKKDIEKKILAGDYSGLKKQHKLVQPI
jgi:RNA processing factor Prp31